jgi:hypothetical protein
VQERRTPILYTQLVSSGRSNKHEVGKEEIVESGTKKDSVLEQHKARIAAGKSVWGI